MQRLSTTLQPGSGGKNFIERLNPNSLKVLTAFVESSQAATVDKAYEASGGKKHYKSDAERVAFLFELYQKYTSLLPAVTKKVKIRKPKSQDHE